MLVFLAQTQTRLGVLALRIESDAEKLTITTNQNGATLEITGRRVTIPLPGRPLPTTQSIRLHNRKAELKIPIQREERGRVDVVQPPVGAGELNARRVRRARCKACRREVWSTPFLISEDDQSRQDTTDHPAKRRRTSPPSANVNPENTGYTFRALPSAHWYESSEAWLCHPSGEFTKKLAGVMQHGWWPSREVGLVGERWVGVEVGVCEGEIEMEPSLTTWLPLYCPSPTCDSTLGTRNIRSVTREEGANPPEGPDIMDEGEQLVETWRLDKYAVEFLGADEKSPLSCNVDEILATEMLEHAQSLGIRKFRLADEVSGEEQLSLWLFNPDVDITWGTADLDSPKGEGVNKVQSGKFVTVLWQDLKQTNRPPIAERFETLEYPSSAVQTIRAILAGQVDGVPADGMTMGEWQVGYLRR